MLDGFDDHGLLDGGYLANMVARAALQDLPSPSLAFVAFAGPYNVRAACPYNVRAGSYNSSGAYNIVPLGPPPQYLAYNPLASTDMLAGQHTTRQARISRRSLFRM